jgi:hypothetical protein
MRARNRRDATGFQVRLNRTGELFRIGPPNEHRPNDIRKCRDPRADVPITSIALLTAALPQALPALIN